MLRGGAPTPWVQLNRLNPPEDPLPQLPASREGALVDAVAAAARLRLRQTLARALS